ncbi:MAG: glucose-6-phosphate isomerase [Chitinivibrionales bacterium]|nr:glucose-6-phosphate isomerase [Chitinivibrionales bacterium]
MSILKIDYDSRAVSGFLPADQIAAYDPALEQAEKMLASKGGLGADFLGWLALPSSMPAKTLDALTDCADQIRGLCDVLVCIGIGGSYLGAKAAIEFTGTTFEDQRKPRVIFAGHHLNSDFLSDLIALLENKEVCVNVISKSGTTTEPGVTFRVLREFMERKYGKPGAAKRIIATTDPNKGALRSLAAAEGYQTFAIPSDVGGRYSVLTPVGLLPMAVAGIKIKNMLGAAAEIMQTCSLSSTADNMAGRYAAIRNLMFRRGKTIEVMATFQPQAHFLCEWWKQLSGESEGKNNTGIFPAAVDYTTDLHSLGQWMQEGLRSVFETFLLVKKTKTALTLPRFTEDGDELNYLAGKTFEEINREAYRGTLLAHTDGGVPTTTLTLTDRSEETLGQAFYFFEKAIAISGYMLRVNPFDQPGVEAYKTNMFALLGKSGFEKQTGQLKSKLKDLGL